MKFGKQIQSQQTPGWGSFYCDYKGLKKIINSLAKGRPADAALLAAGIRPPRPAGPEEPLHPSAEPLIANTSSVGGRNGDGTLLQAHKAAFFFKLERELEKINTFYYQREATLKVRLRTLIDKRKLLQASLSDAQGKVKPLTRESSSYGALYEGFRNFERDLGRLQAYVEMNATAFRKILKKWDKACRRQADRLGAHQPQQGEHDGQLYLARQVEVAPIFNREFIAELSDVASANLLSLENLVGGEGDAKRRGAEALADGTGIEGKAWSMSIDQSDSAEALEDLEQALVSAVKSRDEAAVAEILKILVPQGAAPATPVSRILFRAVLEDQLQSPGTQLNGHAPTEEGLIPTGMLDFSYVDDINGRTCLHEAASAGRESLVRVCLEKHVPLSQADVYGRQPLHYAAINGHSEVCRILLAAGADPTVADLDGYSPIIYSVTNGHVAVVQTFIDQGVSFETPQSTNEDLNPLSLACQYGHEDIARLLLQRGAKILPNPAGYYPQHLAAREGHAGVLRLLVEATRGFSGIDMPDKYSQATPLIHASSEGHVEAVNVLLQAGSNVHARDEFRKTPLHYAAWKGHIDVVVLLLAAGATSDMTLSPDLPHPGSTGATASMSSADMDPLDLDLESDLIPSLSLPPPIIPFRIYGHNYLDKKSLVHITLGHPNTSRSPHLPPVRLTEQTGRGQHPSLKLVMTPRSDSGAIPHSVILPLSDEGEVFPFQVDTFDTFSLEFDLFPTFGSKFIGKGVALPSMFSDLQSQGSYYVPLLDPHLKVIGDIPFEVNVVKPFLRAQLQLGGQLETYWKSTATVAPSVGSEAAPTAGGPSVVTASSLSGEHVRTVVQVTSDGVPVAYPAWRLPVEGFDVHVGEVTYAQFQGLAERTGKKLDTAAVVDKSDPAAWYQAIAGALVSLEEVLKVLPPAFGVDLEVRYPTRSDVRRLKLHNILEVNQYVDYVLSTIYETVQSGGDDHQRRRIVLSSFNPVVCTALNWKQPNFSVFFASYCGLSRSNPEGKMVPANRVEDDRRCTSIREAVKFAKANNLLGVMLDATILVQVPSLIQSAKEHGLLITTFGTTSRVPLADAHMSNGVLHHASSAFLKQTEAS